MGFEPAHSLSSQKELFVRGPLGSPRVRLRPPNFQPIHAICSYSRTLSVTIVISLPPVVGHCVSWLFNSNLRSQLRDARS